MGINSELNVHNLVVFANIFVRKDGKYLMLKRSIHKNVAPGFVHPYGGKMNISENPYEAAEREVLEEAGIRVKNLRTEAVI